MQFFSDIIPSLLKSTHRRHSIILWKIFRIFRIFRRISYVWQLVIFFSFTVSFVVLCCIVLTKISFFLRYTTRVLRGTHETKHNLPIAFEMTIDRKKERTNFVVKFVRDRSIWRLAWHILFFEKPSEKLIKIYLLFELQRHMFGVF